VNFGLLTVPALGVDLSEGGLDIEVEETIYSGNDVSIRMPMTDGGPPIITLAKASWTKAKGNLMVAGLQLVGVNPASTTNIPMKYMRESRFDEASYRLDEALRYLRELQ